MNANAQDFDPNRVGRTAATSHPHEHIGYQQQQQPLQQQQFAYRNQHGMIQTSGRGGGDGVAYYDPSIGYHHHQRQSRQDYRGAAAYYSQATAAAANYVSTDPASAVVASHAWNETANAQLLSQEALVPGSYYPTIPNIFQPQLYGAPISALAYDDEYEVIYVASHTQSIRNQRSQRRFTEAAASMMVTHSTLDGMLYSSCAAHPEADPSTLDAMYQTFYRNSSRGSKPSTVVTHIPPHAYEPLGTMDSSTTTNVGGGGGVNAKHRLGVTTLLPLKGYVASVSPAAVRVHTHGGLCVTDVDLQGMMCGTMHPGKVHVFAGGIAAGRHKSHIHCMDMYQDLRIVSSSTLRSDKQPASLGVMCMATNYEKQTLAVGCSDGTLRLLDASFRSRGRIAELAKVKSHVAGVSNVAVSHDGNLICTTGFQSCPTSDSNIPYAFPDQHVLIYDVRYLGRGGILHPFSAVHGGPRFISFIPDVPSQPSNRILVASGQIQGGIQIITPFDMEGADYLVPQLSLSSRESMTALHVSDQYLAIGTSNCNVLQYELAGYRQEEQQHTKTSPSYTNAPEFVPSSAAPSAGRFSSAFSDSRQAQSISGKKPLVLPPYVPNLPPMSMDPMLLQSSGNHGVRNGGTDKLKSIFTAYIMCADPTTLSKNGQSAFDAFANNVLLTTPKRSISSTLLTHSSKMEGDVMSTIMTSDIGVNLFENETDSKREGQENDVLLNPNRLLHSKKASAFCYEKIEAREGRKSRGRSTNTNASNRGKGPEEDNAAANDIPKQYRLTLKPSHSKGSTFNQAVHNRTDLWPGWDYPPSMPNAYAPPVLFWLYFVPEMRSIMMTRQFEKPTKPAGVPPLISELGCVFYQIECLSKYARCYPDESALTKVGAFVPANFLASLASMPEADALALLDGNPAAVERALRPEAFFRFLLIHLNKELLTRKGGSNIIDDLHGFTMVKVDEFITGAGPPTISKQHGMTVDLSYDPFVKNPDENVMFGEVLRHALSKESRLRAWCQESRSYETAVQRKIATSLPTILALSCCCAGKHKDEGLSLWRRSASENDKWLPEFIEVEIEENGNIIVREMVEEGGASGGVWKDVKGSSASLPPAVADIVKANFGSSRSHRYRLESVLSFIRDGGKENADDKVEGHHVLHARIPPQYKRQAYERQLVKAQMVASLESAKDVLTLTSGIKEEVFKKRIEDLEEKMKSLGVSESDDDEWVLFNGFVVSPTDSKDTRAFPVYKDPCLVVFRAVDNADTENGTRDDKNIDSTKESSKLGFSVMQTKSICSGRKPEYMVARSNMLPGQGDLIAFDCEFVAVQLEESTLDERGSKVTVRESRLALARVSVVDCRNGAVIVDDYVLPSEPVVDYLTRFSGITASDLDPKTTPHHLVTMQSAYMKLRYLTERGCIFVGHGLAQDFATVNLVVPPDQIIDTVEIYHQERMRRISLRFLTNYVFRRDVQQDVHDSVEDARAAHALYLRAVELKREGTFDKFLQDLYVYGAARDWKLGVDE